MLIAVTILEVSGIIFNEVSYITQTGMYEQIYKEFGVDVETSEKNINNSNSNLNDEVSLDDLIGSTSKKDKESDKEVNADTERENINRSFYKQLGIASETLLDNSFIDINKKIAADTCKTMLVSTRLLYIPIILGLDFITLIIGAVIILIRWMIIKTDSDIGKYNTR